MIKQNKKYKELYTTDKRYIIITGGRGSGKSFHANTAMCLLTYEQGHRVLFTRYTMSSAEISIIPEFTNKIELMNKEADFHVNKTEITNKVTGSEIIFRGIKTSSGNQTANLKSIADVTTWVLDEAEELIDESIFDKINLSIRTNKAKNRVIMVLNPSNKKHWIYKKFFEKHLSFIEIDGVQIETTTHPDVLHIHSTYLDNINNLSASFIKDVEDMRKTDFNHYCHVVLGQWLGRLEGALFVEDTFRYFKTLPEHKPDSVLGYVDVADEGSDYLCALWAKIYDGKIYITDAIFTQDTIDVTCPMVSSKIKELNADYTRIEANNQGSGFIRLLRQSVQEDKVLSIKNTANKHTRILMAYHIIKNKFVYVHPDKQTDEYRAMMQQIYEYKKDGKSKHDDAPDAMAGLANFIQALLPHIFE
jgi:PBSX family phage terminase large subunit